MNEDTQTGDAELAVAARGGDMAAFEALVSRHGGRLFSFLAQMARSRSDAEDLAQTVWVTVHRQLHRFDPARSFTTWLFTIARNTAISAWRRRKPEAQELGEHDLVDRAHPGERVFRNEEADNIWNWVAENLGAEQRDALWLMYHED